MRTKQLIFVFILFLGFFMPLELPAQCAMCKEAAESSMTSDPTSMARSLNKGILYLMAVPYLMIAFIFRKQLYHLGKKAGKKLWRSRQVESQQ